MRRLATGRNEAGSRSQGLRRARRWGPAAAQPSGQRTRAEPGQEGGGEAVLTCRGRSLRVWSPAAAPMPPGRGAAGPLAAAAGTHWEDSLAAPRTAGPPSAARSRSPSPWCLFRGPEIVGPHKTCPWRFYYNYPNSQTPRTAFRR